MGWLGRLLLGSGTLKPEVRAELEAEGLVLVEEGMSSTLRYERFRAPGRYHHGKVVWERVALGISEHRVVLYCRSGRVELIDSEFSAPNLHALDLAVEGHDTVVLRVDYDRLQKEKVRGVITIRARTPRAHEIVGELKARIDPDRAA